MNISRITSRYVNIFERLSVSYCDIVFDALLSYNHLPRRIAYVGFQYCERARSNTKAHQSAMGLDVCMYDRKYSIPNTLSVEEFLHQLRFSVFVYVWV